MASWKVSVTMLLLGVAVAMVSASVVEQILKVPLFEIGGLWVKATHDATANVRTLAASVLNPTASFWSYVGACVGVYVTYKLYVLLFANYNRVRQAHEVGFAATGPDGRHLSAREVYEASRRRRDPGDTPPVYPNGWFAVMESRDLKVNEVKSVSYLGESVLPSL